MLALLRCPLPASRGARDRRGRGGIRGADRGGVMIGVAGPFFDGTVLPMLAVIAICGVLAFALSRVVLAGRVVAA